jgi:predicted CoA-binding protein
MNTIEEVLRGSRTVAIVGLSSKEDRPSHRVGLYLQSKGYRIIPVNPGEAEVLGQRSYPDLVSIPEPVDVVDVFRRSADVPPVVEEAIKVKAKVVWMQEGVVNERAAKRARSAGLKVVMDHCMRKEHIRLFGEGEQRE